VNLTPASRQSLSGPGLMHVSTSMYLKSACALYAFHSLILIRKSYHVCLLIQNSLRVTLILSCDDPRLSRNNCNTAVGVNMSCATRLDLLHCI